MALSRFPTFPIQAFVLVPADPQAVTEACNTIVGDTNRVLSGGLLGATEASIRQLRAWAAATGSPKYIYTIANDMAASHSDLADALLIQWDHGTKIVQGDDLDVYLAALLGGALPYPTIKGYPL